jgi:hypothetical protein
MQTAGSLHADCYPIVTKDGNFRKAVRSGKNLKKPVKCGNSGNQYRLDHAAALALFKKYPMQQIPFLLSLARGAIGKEIVIKRYRYGKIITRFPDMSRIIASAKQRKCRDLFKLAVAYAKEVIADGERKRTWQKRIRRRNGVYNEAVKYYMLKDKKAKEAEMLEAARLLRLAMKQQDPVVEIDDAPAHSVKRLNEFLSTTANMINLFLIVLIT